MKIVTAQELRNDIEGLLKMVNSGKSVIVSRNRKKVAKLVGMDSCPDHPLQFPDRSQFRKNLPPSVQAASEIIRQIRDERY